MTTEFRIEGLDRLRRQARPERFRPFVKRGLEKSALAVVRGAIERAPTGADGRLKGDIDFELIDGRPWPKAARVGTKVGYARFVEFGTPPHFPPPKALERWVRLKLRVSADQAPSVAFLIARKISRVGTKPQPFLIPALDAAKPQIRRIWQGVGREIVRWMARGR